MVQTVPLSTRNATRRTKMGQVCLKWRDICDQKTVAPTFVYDCPHRSDVMLILIAVATLVTGAFLRVSRLSALAAAAEGPCPHAMATRSGPPRLRGQRAGAVVVARRGQAHSSLCVCVYEGVHPHIHTYTRTHLPSLRRRTRVTS